MGKGSLEWVGPDMRRGVSWVWPKADATYSGGNVGLSVA